jgi:hypothetical protein
MLDFGKFLVHYAAKLAKVFNKQIQNNKKLKKQSTEKLLNTVTTPEQNDNSNGRQTNDLLRPFKNHDEKIFNISTLRFYSIYSTFKEG